MEAAARFRCVLRLARYLYFFIFHAVEVAIHVCFVDVKAKLLSIHRSCQQRTAMLSQVASIGRLLCYPTTLSNLMLIYIPPMEPIKEDI